MFYDCEEVEAERNGLLRLSRRRPDLLAGDFAVLMEPTGDVVEGGCQGTLRAEVLAAGQRAHSARSWLGRNAIHEAAGILDVLRGYQAREPQVDGLVYHEGLNAVAISGGVAMNVIPDECVVTVNFRFAPDRSIGDAEAHVQGGVRGLGCPGHRCGRRREARAGRAGGRVVRRRGRRNAAGQAGLDRCGQVRRAGHPGGQLRPR